MRYNDSKVEMSSEPRYTDAILASCRNHIESLQNLNYLNTMDADHPTEVRLNSRMMEWHLYNLAEVLLAAA